VRVHLQAAPLVSSQTGGLKVEAVEEVGDRARPMLQSVGLGQ